MNKLLDEVQIEKARRAWELSKYSTNELKDEIASREAVVDEVNHFEHKEELDVTDGVVYCNKCERNLNAQ